MNTKKWYILRPGNYLQNLCTLLNAPFCFHFFQSGPPGPQGNPGLPGPSGTPGSDGIDVSITSASPWVNRLSQRRALYPIERSEVVQQLHHQRADGMKTQRHKRALFPTAREVFELGALSPSRGKGSGSYRSDVIPLRYSQSKQNHVLKTCWEYRITPWVDKERN